MKERMGDEKLIIISVAVRGINDHIRLCMSIMISVVVQSLSRCTISHFTARLCMLAPYYAAVVCTEIWYPRLRCSALNFDVWSLNLTSCFRSYMSPRCGICCLYMIAKSNSLSASGECVKKFLTSCHQNAPIWETVEALSGSNIKGQKVKRLRLQYRTTQFWLQYTYTFCLVSHSSESARWKILPITKKKQRHC